MEDPTDLKGASSGGPPPQGAPMQSMPAPQYAQQQPYYQSAQQPAAPQYVPQYVQQAPQYVQQAPQQQPYYQQPPQQYYATPPQGYQQQIYQAQVAVPAVVVTTELPDFGYEPQECVCPFCRATVVTNVNCECPARSSWPRVPRGYIYS